MSTIIESLLMEFGIDASGMSKGAKDGVEALKKLEDAEKKVKKETEDTGKKMAMAIGKLRNELLGLLGLFTAGTGLKQFFNSMTNGDAAVGRLAKNINTSVSEFTAWQGVAERAGGSAEGIAGSMVNLTQQFQQLALTGQSAVIPYFRAVGVSIADAQGHLRPLNDILLEVSDKFASMDPAKAQALGRGMGFDEGTVNVLMKGRAALVELLKEQERIGHANEKDTKAAQERQAAIRGLMQASEDAGRKILTVLTPAIIELTKWLQKLGDWFKVHPKIATTAVTTLTAAVVALSAAMAVGAVASFASMAAAGVSAFGSILAAAGPAAAAVAAAAGGYALGTGANILINKGLSAATGHETTLGSAIYDLFNDQYDPNGGKKKSLPRGIRNNNPGNLNFVGQAGATKEGGANGRFAVFKTMQDGIAELANQLRRYSARGIDTIQEIISKFAPPSENNTKAYINAISKKLGVDKDKVLNLGDNSTLGALIEGITTMENGRGRISPDLINSTLSARGPRKGAGSRNDIKSEVHIGEVNVNTNATDARGIAKDMRGALTEHFDVAAMANYGLA